MRRPQTLKSLLAYSVALTASLSSTALASEDCQCRKCQEKQMSCAAQPSAAAAAPGDGDNEEEPVAAVAAPTMFSAPSPTGEVTGARSGIGLPSLRLTMPRLSIETPELSVLGFSRSRRDAQMHIDAAAAPASPQSPLLFGQIQSNLHSNGAAAAASPSRTKKDDPGAAAAGPSDEGCTSLESRKVELLTRQVNELQKLLAQQNAASGAAPQKVAESAPSTDPWASSRASEVAECEQSVAELSAQLSELQRLVTQLAELQAAEPQLKAVPQASIPKAKKVNPWQEPTTEPRDEEATPVNDPDKVLLSEQAERIARLEAQLAKLSNPEPVQQASHEQVDSVAGVAKLPSQLETTSQTPRKSVLSRIGSSRSRR